MSNLPDFISDLAIILISAGVVTIIFKALKQPVVLGYIVAGFLASLHFKRFAESLVEKAGGKGGFFYDMLEALPEISDMANVSIWADIGVIFLLFALGLDFSFKKLAEVGGTAAIATCVNSGAMILIGYTAGHLLGWSQMDSIFLGGMLSMSSTTIIIKSFNDMGLQKKKFAGIVLAMLIIEDLMAVLMMVLLSAIAVSSNFEGTDLVFSILKLGFFILIWFLVGIYLIPTVFKKLKKHLNDETLLVLAIGLCLGMVYFATSVGFSSALGAFVMGSILAETVESKQIERLLEPLKNIFGAIFFVSVGMMIDPSVIIEYAPIIFLITLLVILGRSFFGTMGVLASGQSLKVAVQSGFSVALIGEFSFIIASLGMDLGVISERLYPIIVTVSVITTFTAPYMMKASGGVYNKIEKVIPKTWQTLINGYAASSYKTVGKHHEWKSLFNATLRTVIIYFTISLAILLLSYNFVTPLIEKYIHNIWGNVLDAVVTLLIMAPFLRSMMLKNQKTKEFIGLWRASNLNKGLLTFMVLARVIISVILVTAVLVPLFPQVSNVFLLLIAIVFTILIILTKEFKKQSRSIEAHFMTNLYTKEAIKQSNSVLGDSAADDLRKKEIHVEEIDISPYSPKIGKTLRELNFRQTTGVNIVCIIRGDRKINIPDGNEQLFPYDKIVVTGSDEEIQGLIKAIEERKRDRLASAEEETEEEIEHHIDIAQYPVQRNSIFVGKNIIDLDIQNKTECMIIGVDRDNHSITDFGPTFIFNADDVLWLAGESNKLDDFAKKVKA